nr:hypothetical protein [Tanacetum cinerariifolium]
NAGGIDSESEEIEDFLNDESIQFEVEDSPFNMDKDILFLESLLRDDPILPHLIIPKQTKLPIEETNHSLKIGNDDLDDEVDVDGDLCVDNVIQNSEHEYSESEDSDLDNPLLPLLPPEPPDKEFDFEKKFQLKGIWLSSLNVLTQE